MKLTRWDCRLVSNLLRGDTVRFGKKSTLRKMSDEFYNISKMCEYK